MTDSDADLKKNEQELLDLAKSIGISVASGWGLGKVLQYVFGGGAKFIGIVLGIFQSFKDSTRKMAESSVRKRYGDDKIVIMGQQVAGTLNSEELWTFVNRVGGVVWVQDVRITRADSLAFCVFWHPEHTFKLGKDVIRLYRSVGSQCTIDESQGAAFRAAN